MFCIKRRLPSHYENMSMQYTAILHGSKNEKFKIKKMIIFLFLLKNIDCGYTLEPPQFNECQQSMF